MLLLSYFSRVQLCVIRRRQPTRLLRYWDSLGNNTGVGYHFLLQCVKVKVKSLSHVRLVAIPWTAAHQAPLSVGFSRQEYWSGLPLPSLVFMLSFLFLPESILGVSLNNVEVVVPTPHTIENLHTIISASKTDEWINDSSKDRKLKQFR